MPATSKAENFIFTTSTDFDNGCISHFFAAYWIFSKPFVVFEKFNFCFNLSIVDILVATFFSNNLLSKRISTTFWSIVVLIIWKPPSMRY